MPRQAGVADAKLPMACHRYEGISAYRPCDPPSAGVAENVAERVLGHALPGVRGVYNRYDYADEKADALQRLAAKIETIVNPPSGNVVPFPAENAKVCISPSPPSP